MTPPHNYYHCFLMLLASCQLFEIVSAKIFKHSFEENVNDWQRGRLFAEKNHFRAPSRIRRQAGGGSGSLNVHEFHFPDSDHDVASVHWSGRNSTTMFILTMNMLYNGTVTSSKLWRSTDYGSTFSPVKFPDEDAIITDYYVCPNNKNKLVFCDEKHKRLYRTTDEGASFEALATAPVKPDYIVFHPTDQNVFLIFSQEQQKLYVTFDFGASLDLVMDYVNPRFFWAVPGIDADNYTIHMEVQDLTTGLFKYKAVKRPYPTEVSLVEDIGYTDVDSLLVQKEYIFIQKSDQFYSHLYVSHNRGPFRRAFFPNNIQPQDFSIVNADEHQVFLAASFRSFAVHLYLSDTTGRFFTTSLTSVMAMEHSQGAYTADLYEVKGLTGTYIVNYYKTSAEPSTLITFDQGGKWQPIQAPTTGLDGKPTNCHTNDGCSLNLHLIYSSFLYDVSMILSEENAPGMILSQGNLGDKLVPSKSDLFFSSDGGYSWKPLFAGNYSKTIIDQGGAMVLVSLDKSYDSHEAIYSCDEWRTSQNYTFTSGSLRIYGVLNEPGITSRVVSVFGHSDNKAAGWTVIKLDFSQIISRKCSQADYIKWSPSFGPAGDCLLGQKLTYYRRIPDVLCYIGDDHVHYINSSTCECQELDFECDYGYEKKGATCQAAPWFDPSVPVDDCPEGSTYMRSSGYRKVAADKCSGGELTKKYKPTNVSCPLVAPGKLLLVANSNTNGVLTSRQPATFILYQEKGSKKSTRYEWNFGDDKPNKTSNGFDGAHNQTHTYLLRGTYIITVIASNGKGKSSATLDVLVEDRLEGLYVTLPHAAQINTKLTMTATLFTKSIPVVTFSRVHYVWRFGDAPETMEGSSLLSWQRQAEHTYKNVGNYSGQVEAMNSLGSVFSRFTVAVFHVVKTYTLGFDAELEGLQQRSLAWRELYASVVKKTLSDELEWTRLDVIVQDGNPLIADVTILPVSQLTKNTDDINKIGSLLEKKVSEGKLKIELGREDFGYHVNISVTSATEVKEVDNKTKSNIAVYVCVPILLVAIFISGLIFYYYKRKLSHVTRYSLLRSHRSPVTDSLLEDTDDDDPPLDPNPDTPQNRLALSDDDLADDPLGAHLMMDTSGNNRSNTVNC